MDEEKGGGGDGGWNGVEGLGRRGATPKRRKLVLAMPARPSLESLGMWQAWPQGYIFAPSGSWRKDCGRKEKTEEGKETEK